MADKPNELKIFYREIKKMTKILSCQDQTEILKCMAEINNQPDINLLYKKIE